MHCVLSSRHSRPISRPSTWEKRSIIGKTSFFNPSCREMYSASHVDDAVDPWRFERHANGQQRSPSAE
eukprot:10447633-Heterocapsa_arctica.AAC.1